MVVITEREYDNGAAGGDGLLTKETQHVDSSTTRATTFLYDWRNRQTDVDGEEDFYQITSYDNLNRAVRVDRHDTTASARRAQRNAV